MLAFSKVFLNCSTFSTVDNDNGAHPKTFVPVVPPLANLIELRPEVIVSSSGRRLHSFPNHSSFRANDYRGDTKEVAGLWGLSRLTSHDLS